MPPILLLVLLSLCSLLTTSHAQTPPVTLTAPTAGAQLKGPVNFTAHTSDPAALSAVQWCVDTTPVPGAFTRNGQDYTSPLVQTSTLADGPHTVRVSVRKATGPTMTSAATAVVVDNSVPPPPPVPPAPTGLTAKAVSASQIDVTWQKPVSSTDVTGYQVYRDGVLIETVTGLTVSMTCLFPATPYSFTVIALYGAGAPSAHSATATVQTLGGTTTDNTPPSVPTLVHGIAINFSQITLLWTASTDNVAVARYEVFQNGAPLGASAEPQRVVMGLTPSTTYSFTVAAVDTSGNVSAQSPPVSVTTLPLPPSDGQPAAFKLHHDNVPHFARSATIVSAKSGLWSDPASWAPPRVPGVADIVRIGTHTITYDSITGDVDVLGVDVGGVFAFHTTRQTKLALRTLLVMPSGTLQIGTVQNPIAGNVTAELVIKDVPINTTTDPAQYGNGVVVINGTVLTHGAKKEPTFLRLGAEPKAGESTLTTVQGVVGWQVGDRLVVPDTRQLTGADVVGFDQANNVRRLASQSEVVTIQSINGTTLTLTTPLKFDHLGARDMSGKLDFLPHIGNLSRNIVVRSANPAGTRGHTLFTGVSMVDVRYTAFNDLGRTQAELLDNTTFDSEGVPTHIGRNQIGRYPIHNHHNYGPCAGLAHQFTYAGNVVAGSGRWGITVHGSHYGLIQDNIVYDVKGAGIAAEDGSETDNVFDHNFVVKSENQTRLTDSEASGNFDPLGRKGNGFWFRGMNNIMRNNVIADTREGVGFYVGSDEDGPTGPHISVNVPTHRCAQTTVPGQFRIIERIHTLPNKEFHNNEIYSTSEMGLGSWVNPGFGVAWTNTTIWHTHGTAIFLKYTDPTFDGLVIRNKGGSGSGIQQFNDFGGGGNGASAIRRADVQGVDIIYRRAGQIALAPNYTIADSYFVSRRGFLLDANGQGLEKSRWTFTNVKFGVLPGVPLKTISTSFNQFSGDRSNARRDIFVTGYQGNPQDNFRIYFTVQDPAGQVYHLESDFGSGAILQGCPVGGITNQQCWDRHGIATFQQLAPCTDTTTHPEISGFTCR